MAQLFPQIRDEGLALIAMRKIKAADKNDDAGFNSFFKYGWKRFYLKWYEAQHPSAETLCPNTVALLRENSLFGVLSLLTGQRSDRFYHAIAFTRVEMVTAPAASVRKAIEQDASVGLLMLQGLSSRILQTETMIETLTHRDMSSRLVSLLLVLCRDFGVPSNDGITIDLRLSHQAIAEAIGSTRVTITRLLGDLRNAGLVQIDRKKITVFDPLALAKRFS